MTKWLKENGLCLSVHYHEIINNKPSAIAHIDDDGIKFDNNCDEIEVIIDQTYIKKKKGGKMFD